MTKVKDNKPKGRVSAYAFFVKHCREEHKKKNPNAGNIDIADFSRKNAELWKKMTDKDKKKFGDMADKDKQRYQKEMSTYVPLPGEGKRKRKKKDPNAPKRPLSGFFFFCSDERAAVKAKHPNFSVGEIGKELGLRWGKVSAADKAKFNAKALADRARYERESATYKKAHPEAKKEKKEKPAKVEKKADKKPKAKAAAAPAATPAKKAAVAAKVTPKAAAKPAKKAAAKPKAAKKAAAKPKATKAAKPKAVKA
jgi:hypothetical protein